MPWSDRFDDPIPLPDGRQIVTLEDAANYIQKLPKARHRQAHWQDAIEHLIKAAEGSPAWMMFAGMFMLRALHYGRPEPDIKEPRRKRAKSYRIVRSTRAESTTVMEFDHALRDSGIGMQLTRLRMVETGL